MLDVAIVGSGLCGLALAESLQAQGVDYAMFEARQRAGGRVLSRPRGDGGSRVDLGPSWYWPQTQPRMSALIDRLGIANLAQHDTGTVLRLNDTDKAAQVVPFENVHGGARRVADGMATLVEKLIAKLDADRLQFSHVLTTVQDRGDHVELHFRYGEQTVSILAQRVVIAIPPRVVDEHVRFAPELDTETRVALRNTPTWMAASAKVAVAYSRAAWRETGHAGNAFVMHEQAVVGEIFDACDESGASSGASSCALGGFIALSPMLRISFKDGLPMLIENQMTQVFGSGVEGGELHYQDWALEMHTCAALDHNRDEAHPQYGDLRLRRAIWDKKLFFGGSETASSGGGYLEGALDAAARIARTLGANAMRNHSDRFGSISATDDVDINEASLARFSQWVVEQRADALQRYRRHLNQGLAAQNREQLTQRALLGTVEQIYSEALQQLDELSFEAHEAAAERGRSALTPPLLDPFDGFINALLDEAVCFNNTSCALSNFPVEHKPDADYLQTIKRDLVAAWREFAVSANSIVIAKTAREGANMKQRHRENEHG